MGIDGDAGRCEPICERKEMTSRTASLLIAASLVLGRADDARAGMPSIVLTDLARMRLQTISFFLLGILASGWVVQRIWNALGRDFPRLPRLGYGKALGLVALWGLLFVLVLTMISGARELMTPGAWEKDGLTYKLAEDDRPAPVDPHEAERRHGPRSAPGRPLGLCPGPRGAVPGRRRSGGDPRRGVAGAGPLRDVLPLRRRPRRRRGPCAPGLRARPLRARTARAAHRRPDRADDRRRRSAAPWPRSRTR